MHIKREAWPQRCAGAAKKANHTKVHLLRDIISLGGENAVGHINYHLWMPLTCPLYACLPLCTGLHLLLTKAFLTLSHKKKLAKNIHWYLKYREILHRALCYFPLLGVGLHLFPCRFSCFSFWRDASSSLIVLDSSCSLQSRRYTFFRLICICSDRLEFYAIKLSRDKLQLRPIPSFDHITSFYLNICMWYVLATT